MPTYDYLCAKCGEMEVFQSIRDDALERCPQCGSKRFSRQISAGAGVIFKGSGFWETDYNRSSEYRKQSKAEGGGDSADAGGAGAKDSSNSGTGDSTASQSTASQSGTSTKSASASQSSTGGDAS